MSDNTSSDCIELRAGPLRMALRPGLGGSIEGLWHGSEAILRSHPPGSLQRVREAASYPLVPFSNRVAHAQLVWNGTAHPLIKNFSPEPHAIHGVGWLRPWVVLESSENFAMLSLEHKADASWPFAFDASQTFRLKDDALELTLSITNQSSQSAPVGLGWHPFFTKRPRSHIAFSATGRWDMSAEKLPTERRAVSGLDADCAQLDIDHCFDGCNGEVHVRDELFHLRLQSNLRCLVVYTHSTKDFVCIEPVSHVNNAMNQSAAQALGVRVLEPGQSWSASMSIDIQHI
jgi:aldose 1-epimerase